MTKKPQYKVFTINFKDIYYVIKLPKKLIPDISIHYSIIVSLEYHEFFNVFSYEKSDKISLYKAYNYHILLKKGTKYLFDPLYNISSEKMKSFTDIFMKTWIKYL